MQFNSLIFLCFIALVFGVYFLRLPWTVKKTFLLIASYAFYAAWNPPFVLLLWISTVVDWWCARGIAAAASQTGKRFALALSLLVNLGMLGTFKYGGFVIDNSAWIAEFYGVDTAGWVWSVALPVGISFYTFQTLSYTIDIYRGDLDPSKSFLDFALFVTFFPQLVAGPIVRARHFLPQLAFPRPIEARHISWGLNLFLLGLFQKVALADGLLAPIADRVYDVTSGQAQSSLSAWCGTFAFSGQIYCDFAGYSTCAIGIALCMGFRLPDNFRFPYGAIGFSDFWRRWHISLSSWLRDYLYISMGGNRGTQFATARNLAVTMLLGGLWHGAAWTFVAWGALHGLYLVIERAVRGTFLGRLDFWHSKPGRAVLTVVTFLAVTIAWVFFRAANFSDAWAMLSSMFGFGGAHSFVSFPDTLVVGILLTGIVVLHRLLAATSLEAVAARAPAVVRGVINAAMLLSILFSISDQRAFIYFQF